MKFGRNLPRNQVPEWATSYIKYKALKKLIKSAAEEAKHGDGADTAEFFFSLDRNLEDVNQFYNRKYADAARRLRLLEDRYGRSYETTDSIDKDEVEDLMGALLELRGQLRNLQWYGEVNRRGFVKITKKLDKKVGQAATQRRYLESKVDPKQFATNIELNETMKAVNDWLSKLGDVKVRDDSSSSHSSHSLKRASSKAILSLPAGVLESVDQAIRRDDDYTMNELLRRATTTVDDTDGNLPAILMLNLLQRAIGCRAKLCISQLLKKIDRLDGGDDINKRNCLHRLIISSGRSKSSVDGEHPTASLLDPKVDTTNYIKPAALPTSLPQSSSTKESDGTTDFSRDDKVVVLLQYLLDNLRPQQREALQARDVYGRMPLHYAAQYGFVVICQIIISHMQAWGQFEVSEGIDAPFWQDAEGYAPLHLSVIEGHPTTTKTLLEAENWRGASDRKAAVRKHMSKSGEVLALAVKASFVVIVRLLVEAGVDLDYQDDQGETALHVASRFGHTECASILLEGSESQRADTEIGENTFGWTPLFIACVDGRIGIVQLLIAAKVDLGRSDTDGWTAKEHAALRGHMDIAHALANATSSQTFSGSGSPRNSATNTTTPNKSIADRKSNTNGTTNTNGSSHMRNVEPIKTYGHRYLTKETMILVSLGSMDTRKAIEAVNLDRIPLTDAHSTQLDTALSVVVSASGANGEPSIIDLPVQDNISTEPITFTALDATKVKLLFDIVPTYAGSANQIVGRGVALLSTIKPSIGSKRITLQGDVAVPIMAANTLEVIGSVNFNFLIITPFTHPNMTITEDLTYWKSMASTMVIGHRGLGKNVAARSSLQLGENTIQSFIAAANLGASYVEFDVQLTKDHVPVIYHDFLVSETGIDAPVHTLTLEQFLHVNDGRTPRPSRPSSPVLAERTSGVAQAINGSDSRKHRSMSVGDLNKGDALDMSERMKHTRDFKGKGFKANSRGNFIQAPFTTLEEMFKKLPESIGFNIEMKYPMLHESEEQEMDTYAVELNSFVDTVLTKVYDLGKKRNVIFSSFNPDICLLLSFKQPSIPILFLTDAGTSPVGDIRATSLQEAIRFASRWNLLGVVSAAEPLVLSPRLVKVVKESGLVCVSYGSMNNDPEKVKLQVKEGIDAVIVDSVLAIRKGLTGSDSASTKS
ncbi:glycerophosphodiester phosphodiesterase, partial [Lecanoromycetidae sp. Uapishka_2]